MATYRACPECHHTWLSYDDERPPGGWHEGSIRRYHAGAALPVEDFATFERVEPVRRADVFSDYVTPLLQALASGVAAGLVAAVVASWAGWTWRAPLAVAVFAFAFAWLVLLRRTLDSLTVRELVTQQPEEPATVTRLAVHLDGEAFHEVQLPVEASTLLTLAKALTNARRPFSERELAGRGRPLSGRRQFEDVRDVLLRLGWLRWKDEQQRQLGLELTGPGRAGMAALASGRVRPEEVLR